MHTVGNLHPRLYSALQTRLNEIASGTEFYINRLNRVHLWPVAIEIGQCRGSEAVRPTELAPQAHCNRRITDGAWGRLGGISLRQWGHDQISRGKGYQARCRVYINRLMVEALGVAGSRQSCGDQRINPPAPPCKVRYLEPMDGRKQHGDVRA